MKALLDGPPRQLAAVAALVAAALVVLGSVVLLFVSADDFGLSVADRLGVATSALTFTLPVLLAVALVLRDDGVRPTTEARPLDDAAFDLAASVLGAVASVLLLGRLLADLVAGDAAPLSGYGSTGRAGTFLVDLAALTVTAALTWWCLERRRRPDTGAPPSAGRTTRTTTTGANGAPAPSPGVVAPPTPPTSPPTFRSPPSPPDERWGQPPPPG